MRSVGFIDYYLDEWHANEYPKKIAHYNETHGADYRVTCAYAEIDSPIGGLSTDAWCEKQGVFRCRSIEELCRLCDCVIVLAPANPERHLDYARAVFATGKSAYIDKTFAPDGKTAEAITALAAEYGVKFFSSSALRYAEELSPFAGAARAIDTVGGGSNLEEYIIHQIEMTVKCLGVGASSLTYRELDDGALITLLYPDSRTATMRYTPGGPFSASVTDKTGATHALLMQSPYFDHLIADIFRFFESGEISFPNAETVEVIKIRDAVIRAKNENSESVAI